MTKIHYLKRYPHCFGYSSQHGHRYGYRFTATDSAGKRHNYVKRGFTSIASCTSALRGRQRNVRASRNGSNVTVVGYARRFVAGKRLHCKPSTWKQYRGMFANDIDPYIGGIRVRKLTRQGFDRYCMLPLLKRGFRTRSLASVADRVSTMLNDAVVNGVIERNPLYKYQALKSCAIND